MKFRSEKNIPKEKNNELKEINRVSYEIKCLIKHEDRQISLNALVKCLLDCIEAFSDKKYLKENLIGLHKSMKINIDNIINED